jgi:replicative DNA helicase
MASGRGRKKGGASGPRARPSGEGGPPGGGSVETRDPAARVPPQDIEAERATLGAMLLEGEAASIAVEKLVPQDFYRAAHRTIYQNICEIYDEGQQPDELVLRERLEAKGVLEEVGGVDYLHELATAVPSAANVERYAEIVRERAVARKLINACTASLREAEGGGNIGDILDGAEQRMYEVAGDRVTEDITAIEEILVEEVAALEIRHKNPRDLTGLDTGLPGLNERTSGLQKSDFIILAARPSVGKTALCLRFIDAMSCGSKKREPVLLFTLEMSKQQVGLRMLSARSGVDFHELRTGFFGNDKWDDILEKGMGALNEAPVFIDDTAAIGAMQLRAKARRMKSKHDVKLVIIDYLQLMAGPRAQSREREVAMISGALKALARELEIPVLALSQLRRPSQDRQDPRPQLTDLRESGALEQDADLVLLLDRDRREDGTYANTGVLTIAKQRNGPTGSVYLNFDGKTMRFEERQFTDQPGQ